MREVALDVAEHAETGLFMQGKGVVHLAADVMRTQVLDQRITLVRINNELVVNVGIARCLGGKKDAVLQITGMECVDLSCEPFFSKGLAVERGIGAALFVPAI